MHEYQEIVICGETNTGRKFRPSDWAERLSGLFATMDPNNRTHYSPYVYPVRRGGLACVVVNRALETQDPMAFEFLMNFARDNDLKMVEGRRTARG